MTPSDKQTAALLVRIYNDAQREAERIDPKRKRTGIASRLDSIGRIAETAHYELTGTAPPDDSNPWRKP